MWNKMPEYSRILIEEYCMSHSQTKKTKFLWDMVQKSYDTTLCAAIKIEHRTNENLLVLGSEHF